jgi:multidrug efflux pump
MIAAGMLVGTLFTLFVLPVFYLPFRRRGNAGTGASLEPAGAAPSPPQAPA